ncbi:MAG: sigma-54-dependent Fis family transcriptional regulator, partial [Planctomycetota bacterium]
MSKQREPSKGVILIVDDEPEHRRLFADVVSSLGFVPEEAGSAEEAETVLTAVAPALILLDVRLPGMSGTAWMEKLRGAGVAVPIVLVTAFGEIRQAVESLKRGADDYLIKPIDLDELKVVIREHLPQAFTEDTVSARLPPLPDDVVCRSEAFRNVLETAAVVAPSDAPVLILGPRGAGKEVVARLIRDWSTRADKPMVTANCAGLSETLIESELFGHAKGAFTDAKEARQGVFRAADGGTLFLDEIGELPLHIQAKLLRALESGEITPVGEDRPVRVDIRLIAATNRDLEKEIEAGRFREDLYYRINVIEVRVPPLAERREDILPLARHLAGRFRKAPVRFSPQASNAMLAYSWPGNVRELRNAVQRACLLARGDVILPEHLPPNVTATAGTQVEPSEGVLPAMERAAILATLEECGGNRTQAAKKLGISRRALIYKLRA